MAVADLGNDTLTTYTISELGKLGDPVVSVAEPGFGPRHMLFNVNNPVLYLLGELSSVVCILSYELLSGSFELMLTLPTISEDYTDVNGLAAILVCSDVRSLYVLNRGSNSLTVLLVCPDGRNLCQR